LQKVSFSKEAKNQLFLAKGKFFKDIPSPPWGEGRVRGNEWKKQ